jgi:hypothetical protein
VLWNAFYMDERLQVPLLDDCPNVHVGIATVFIPTWGIEQYTARYGPGRLIFGSNWPQQSPGPLLTYVLYAEVDDPRRQAILRRHGPFAGRGRSLAGPGVRGADAGTGRMTTLADSRSPAGRSASRSSTATPTSAPLAASTGRRPPIRSFGSWIASASTGT